MYLSCAYRLRKVGSKSRLKRPCSILFHSVSGDRNNGQATVHRRRNLRIYGEFGTRISIYPSGLGVVIY